MLGPKAVGGLKMLRAEKRRFSDLQAQIVRIRESLFPNGGLQERVENFSSFYAKWGRAFIKALYDHAPVLEQQFTILMEQPASLPQNNGK